MWLAYNDAFNTLPFFQVVQHKTKRWRGIIYGWYRAMEQDGASKLSSLTVKDYSDGEGETPVSGAENDQVDTIHYMIILDSGDVGPWPGNDETFVAAAQSHLELVKDQRYV